MTEPPRDPWLADAEGTSRRLAARSGLSRNLDVYGALCERCEARYALTADRATCPHRPICEDCWPNGCEDCAWEVHRTSAHRERTTNLILSAALELRTAADDLSDTDLRSLTPNPRGDVLRTVTLTIETLRRIRDVLNNQTERELAE